VAAAAVRVNAAIALAERGLVPDTLVRRGIRDLLARQLAREASRPRERRDAEKQALIERLRHGPIAVHAEAANAQHYEVPPAFFRLMLGPRLKYSCALWPDGVADLAAAEEAMLALSAERAGLQDGMEVLELGCGWGSLCLWIAERHPRSRVLAVSNAAAQRRYIEAEAARRGLVNLELVTADAATFDTPRRFDRVVSVEMFEHLRNHEAFLARVAAWLKPGGALFVHVFAHRELLYLYETEGEETWMARHFFTGGVMPSEDLLPRFQRDLALDAHWRVSGLDYARTLEAWLARLDANRREALAVLAGVHGRAEAPRALRRWRMFLMACSELFGWDEGRAWCVAHYRFARR
jgi:cyclopropane-fatty-acyl-phospholipid synthase